TVTVRSDDTVPSAFSTTGTSARSAAATVTGIGRSVPPAPRPTGPGAPARPGACAPPAPGADAPAGPPVGAPPVSVPCATGASPVPPARRFAKSIAQYPPA